MIGSSRYETGKDTAIDDTDMHLTIGEFSLATGLTTKALRLYAERGILVPAAVDPDTGYRWYSISQTRRGQLMSTLREARVSLAELADLDAFDLEAYRERLQAKRMYEDTALRMAEVISGLSLDDWPVTTSRAAEQPWVGTTVRLVMPEDGDTGAYLRMYATIPQHRAALCSALRAYDNPGDGPGWTTTGALRAGATEVDLFVCVPAARDQRELDWDGFTERVRDQHGGAEIDVLAGVLPERLEVSCSAEVDHGDEAASMAAGIAPRLAVDEYVRAHGLKPLSRSARDLNIIGPDGMDIGSVSVRDIER